MVAIEQNVAASSRAGSTRSPGKTGGLKGGLYSQRETRVLGQGRWPSSLHSRGDEVIHTRVHTEWPLGTERRRSKKSAVSAAKCSFVELHQDNVEYYKTLLPGWSTARAQASRRTRDGSRTLGRSAASKTAGSCLAWSPSSPQTAVRRSRLAASAAWRERRGELSLGGKSELKTGEVERVVDADHGSGIRDRGSSPVRG